MIHDLGSIQPLVPDLSDFLVVELFIRRNRRLGAGDGCDSDQQGRRQQFDAWRLLLRLNTGKWARTALALGLVALSACDRPSSDSPHPLRPDDPAVLVQGKRFTEGRFADLRSDPRVQEAYMGHRA